MLLREMIEKEQGWDTPIVQALEDTDFYFATMCNVYDSKLPDMTMEKKFHCRTEGVDLAKYAPALERELDHLCSLQFREKTLARLGETRFLKPGYIDFLRLLKLNRDHIKVTPLSGGVIDVRSKGPARLTTWFETHTVEILEELYFRDKFADLELTVGDDRLTAKLIKYENLSKNHKFSLSEFGTRRRAFFAWQKYVLKRLIDFFGTNSSHFVGTSNMYLATELGLRFTGSQAHEILQTGQGLDHVRLSQSQSYMLGLWQEVYRGDLGIALSDVVGFDAFLRDFDLFLAKLFDGMRHDSGDPFKWADKAVDHYTKLRINPLTKTLLFSDGLNVDLVERLLRYLCDRALLAFGVGTDFTNDLGPKALQLVMKAVKVNGYPVAKISDSSGKGMCEDPAHEADVRRVFRIGEA